MFKVRGSFVFVLAILILGLITGLPYGVHGQGVKETINIYTAYDSLLIRMELRGAPEVYQYFVADFGQAAAGVSEFTISFIKVNRWVDTYTYFLDGVWYEGTGIEYVPGTKAVLAINATSVFSDVAGFASSLSREFMLAFSYKYRDNRGVYHYQSPYSDVVYNSKLFSYIDSLPYAVAKWAPVTRLPSLDYYNITIRLDVRRGVGDLFISYISHSDGGFRMLLGQIDWEPYANDSIDVDLTIYSRYILLSNVPGYYNVSQLDGYLYVYSASIPPGREDNPLDISISIDYPLIVVYRDFNSTDFTPGSSVEVLLKVENLGGSDVGPIELREYVWWDGVSVELVSGDVESRIPSLGAEESRIMKYVVRINGVVGDLYIGPAEAEVGLPSNITLLYLSQSNILHRDGPLIDVSLDIQDTVVEVGQEYTYKAIVRNKGVSPADNLIVGEYVIGSLDPGEERIVEISISPKTPTDIIMPTAVEVSYIYNESVYQVTSPSLYIPFKPLSILYPAIEVSIDNFFNGSTINMSLLIRNNGLVEASDIYISSDLSGLEGYLEYLGGDFTQRDSLLTVDGLALGLGEELTINAVFNVVSDEPFILPVYNISVAGQPSLTIETPVDIFFNKSIDLELRTSGEEMVIDYPFNVSALVRNNAGLPIYNVTMLIGNYSGDLDVQYTVNNVSFVDSGGSTVLEASVTAESEGVYLLRDVKVSFIFGGLLREFGLGDIRIKFLYGLRVSGGFEPPSVDEASETTLKIVFTSDCPECVSNIVLSVSLPEGLSFEDGSRELVENIVLKGERYEVSYKVRAAEPGDYPINISVSYLFGGEFSVELSGDRIAPVKLVVRENILMRYYIYFAVGLVMALVVAFLVRRYI